MTTLSERLFGLSFLMLWVLLVILLFSAVRHALNAEPKDDDRFRAQDRSHGRIVRHLLEGAIYGADDSLGEGADTEAKRRQCD
ncbi:hypothetical protein ACQ7C1_23080 [Rhizobium sp. Nf11,1]